MPRIDKTCPHCKTVFPCHTWHKKKFCGEECRAAGRARGWKSQRPGFTNSGSFKAGIVPWNKTEGVILKCPCGTVKRLQPNESGRKFCSKPCAYKWRVLKGTFQKGHPDLVPRSSRGHDSETRAKMSATRKSRNFRGPRCPSWRGGHGKTNRAERHAEMGRFEYKEWRTAVFVRDNHTCVLCGAKRPLNADHIKPWATHPSLRYDVSNGRTLCVPCHRKQPTHGRGALLCAA